MFHIMHDLIKKGRKSLWNGTEESGPQCGRQLSWAQSRTHGQLSNQDFTVRKLLHHANNSMTQRQRKGESIHPQHNQAQTTAGAAVQRVTPAFTKP